MKKCLPIAILAILTISACQEDCPEPDVDDINAIKLELAKSGAGAFSVDQLDSVYVVRYQLESKDSFNFPVDTFYFYKEGFYEDDNKIRISKNEPFYSFGPPYYTQFKYRVEDVEGSFRLNIQNIRLKGEYYGDCEYQNLQKTFFLNEDSLDVTGLQDYIRVEAP